MNELRRAMAAAAALLVLALLAAQESCAPARPLRPDEHCQEAAISASNRVFDCNGDADAANALFERFESELSCLAEDSPPTVYLVPDGNSQWVERPALPEGGLSEGAKFDCAADLFALPCETVEELGNDVAAWVAASPNCALIYEPKVGP